jgi:hypothetical protein
MKTSEDCKYFDSCDAPLCPFDVDIDKRTWYADEPICKIRANLKWRKKQRKIAKVATADNGYFTKPLIEKIGRITRSVKGLNPDSDPSLMKVL